MSYNPYSANSLSLEQQQAMRQIANNVYAEKKMTTVNYNPVTDTYHQSLHPNGDVFDWDNDPEITKPGVWTPARNAMKTLGGSATSTDKDHYTYQPFRDEFLPMAVNFNEACKKMALGGGTVTTADYPLMTDTLVDSTSYDIVVRNFNLLPAVTRKPWDKLVYTADDRTPYRNTFGLGELDIAPSTSISYATTTINLKKAQGHVSISRWVDLAIRRHNIRQDNESIIDADFERGFTADLLTTLGGFTDDAVAGVYDTLTNEHNTNNPFLDIYGDATTIRTAGGMANTMIMNSQTYYGLNNNTWMRVSSGGSALGPGVPVQPVGSKGPITHPALPGYQIFIEETVAKGTIFIMDSRATIFLDGPRSTRTVEDNAHNVVDTYSDYWYGSGNRVSTWGIEMTGSVT